MMKNVYMYVFNMCLIILYNCIKCGINVYLHKSKYVNVNDIYDV